MLGIKEIRGWHVLVMIVGFFSVTIGVNALFITLAVSTHPGEDTPRSYLQGLEYNQVLEQRREQAQIGWTARVNGAPGWVAIAVEDQDGRPVRGLDLAGALRHLADVSRDCPLAFSQGDDGVYRAEAGCAAPGEWRLEAHNQGDQPFEMTREIRLSNP